MEKRNGYIPHPILSVMHDMKLVTIDMEKEAIKRRSFSTMQYKDNVFPFFGKKQIRKYSAYLGTYFSAAQTEPLKTLIQQLYQLSVEAQPQRADDDTFIVT